MFDFLGRRKPDHRVSSERRRSRGPVTIGFEQLEGREMLSSGVVMSLIPSSLPPLASMPRPIIGSINPEAGGDGRIEVAPKVRPEPDRRWSRPWLLGGRFRLGGSSIDWD